MLTRLYRPSDDIRRTSIDISGTKIKHVNSFPYLESIITEGSECNKEVKKD